MRDPRLLFCPEVQGEVRVYRSEQECRKEFGCRQVACPLAREFGLKAFDWRMREFSTQFDLWPVKNGCVVNRRH
jgi:hypothetical protein